MDDKIILVAEIKGLLSAIERERVKIYVINYH